MDTQYLMNHVVADGKKQIKHSYSLRNCNKIINELFFKKHSKYAWPFYNPVDVKQLDIPDYYNVIKKPMDLNTIKNKMDDGKYGSPEEFATDVRLIFVNCYLYNAPNSGVVGMAKKLEQVFEERFTGLSGGSNSNGVLEGSVLERSTDRDNSRNNWITKLIALQKQLDMIDVQLQELVNERKMKYSAKRKEMVGNDHHHHHHNNTISNSSSNIRSHEPPNKKGKYGESGTVNHSSAKEVRVKPMTYDEKRQLCLNINKLSEENLGKIYRIVKSNAPSLPENKPKCSDIEIDLEKAKPSTLNKLQAFVAVCLKKKTRKPYNTKRLRRLREEQRLAELNLLTGTGDVLKNEAPMSAPKPVQSKLKYGEYSRLSDTSSDSN